jgi:hypothetical protein
MLVRALTVAALLAVAPPAWALDACFAQSVGPWRGPVWNGSGIETMDTEFHIGPDDTLVGRYHVHDAEPFDGTLTGFQPNGPCEADFTWTDRFGTGTVHIRFDPERGRFTGDWGMEKALPTLIFNGYRTRPPAVS